MCFDISQIPIKICSKPCDKFVNVVLRKIRFFFRVNVTYAFLILHFKGTYNYFPTKSFDPHVLQALRN